jgi:hypothetical protein
MRARSRLAAIRLSSFSLSAQVIASLGVFLLERVRVRNALNIPGGKNEAKRHPDFRACNRKFSGIEMRRPRVHKSPPIIDAFGFDFDHAFGSLHKLPATITIPAKYELFADMGIWRRRPQSRKNLKCCHFRRKG